MVAPSIDADQITPPRGSDDAAILNRVSAVATRVEDLSEQVRDYRERLTEFGHRIDDNTFRQGQALEAMQRQLEERLQSGIAETVRATVQPELNSMRGPLEAQAIRLGAVEGRLERVETIQIESMNALDARFADLGYQTRLALSAGGLVTLAAIMIVLLR